MRLVGLFPLILLFGCAPTQAGDASSGPEWAAQEASGRRCHSPVSTRLIAVEPGRVYIRTRTGQALELTGEDVCIQAASNGAISLRPAVGPATANVCIGEEARLGIVSHGSGRRACNVTVARVVPNEEIDQLERRRSP